MRRSRIEWGLVAVLVASTALGAFGLRAAAPDAGGLRAKLRADAEGAVAAVAAAFEAELESLRGGRMQDALDVDRAEDEGAARDIDARGARDAALFAFHQQELDRAVREGELDAARERAARLAADGDDPWLAAWAMTAEAALARRAGDVEGERCALERLAALPIEARDARGLSRALAARERLSRLDGADFAQRLAIYAALVDDHRALDETATAELAARVRAELEAAEAPDASAQAEFERLVALDAERARQRSLAASGAHAWLDIAEPASARSFRAPADPLDAEQRRPDWIVARAPDGSNRGFALERERLVARTLARPELTVFERAGLRLALGDPVESDAQSLATRSLPIGGDAELLARAGAADLDELLAAERRRFALIAALTGLALAVVLLAGFATARAVARETRAAREREAFVAAVSHELRTPLAATRLLAELLAQGGVEEEKVIEFARRIGAESERLSRLVASILELARLEGTGGRAAPRAPLDLRDVAADAAERFAPLARESGFELALASPPQPLVVRGERDALASALLELLDNARKHADAAHAIELAVERAGERAFLRVLDRGRGVPEPERERIFEPFARLGDELTRDRKGAGLGLALVQRIARAHGGEARCEPRAGGGSAFTIELPLEEAINEESG